MTFLVTGACGFIGSHFAELCLGEGVRIVALDKLTYAGHVANLPTDAFLYKGDICDEELVRKVLHVEQPDAIFNFAAESHVCRSITEASSFIHSNVRGTYCLLKETLSYWRDRKEPKEFRYVQISTDEVFGDLGPGDAPFTEASPFLPNSPYASSKASADHFVSAFSHTYGLPVITTHCSNNYGSRQYPEKLIPLCVSRFIRGEPFVLHGDGSNVRDWLAVEDHCRGILAAFERGSVGSRYCFGGAAEFSNLAVVRRIAGLMGSGEICFGPDRPGNDRRYAIDFGRAERKLSWHPQVSFEDGLAATVKWYEEHPAWIKMVTGRAA